MFCICRVVPVVADHSYHTRQNYKSSFSLFSPLASTSLAWLTISRIHNHDNNYCHTELSLAYATRSTFTCNRHIRQYSWHSLIRCTVHPLTYIPLNFQRRPDVNNAINNYKCTNSVQNDQTYLHYWRKKKTNTHTQKTHLKPINNLNENAIDKTLKVNHSLIVKGQ